MREDTTGRAVEPSLAALETILSGRDLGRGGARELMAAVMAGTVPPARLGGLLTALRARGETVEEITGFAEAMRAGAVPVRCRREGLVDTCGTGGDGSGTFNISTATALLAAGMGIPVAKHGNRAVSSRSGSADVLEALGVNVDLDAARVGALLDELGIAFLFAPRLHPAMRHAGPVRRDLGVRTVFNLLGPLTNPAGAELQLLGVFDPALCEPLARVLGALGSRRAFVVHGAGGLDEVSPLGPTRVAELRRGAVRAFTFDPADAGVDRCRPGDLAGGSPDENAALITGILEGREGPAADAVALNAGFVAVLAGRAPDFRAGVALARATLRSGAGLRLLRQLARAAGAPGEAA
ncbi:MAG: anthranilate phosphoribosyltransferase [bacterium]|nr:anthranilate phosphoribosyltransferase [bacterium]